MAHQTYLELETKFHKALQREGRLEERIKELKRLLAVPPHVCSKCGLFLGLLHEDSCPNCEKLEQAEAERDFHIKSVEHHVEKARVEIASLEAKAEAIQEALVTANDLCRSAMSIAKRQGQSVNWKAFETKLESSLLFQHKKMLEAGLLDGRSNKRREVALALKEDTDDE